MKKLILSATAIMFAMTVANAQTAVTDLNGITGNETAVTVTMAEGPHILQAESDDTRPAMDIATMDRLQKGYAILEGREVYGGGKPDADLLLQLRDKKFSARGRLVLESRKLFLRTVCDLYLVSEDGSIAIFLAHKQFFLESSYTEYLKSLPGTLFVNAWFTVHYNYREISSSPFIVEKFERAE